MLKINMTLKTLVLNAFLVTLIPFAASARDEMPLIQTDGRFSGFDARQHVIDHHPALSAQAEAISHWAGYHLVNPILLANVLEKRYPDAILSSETIEFVAGSLAAPASGDTESTTGKPNTHEQLASRLQNTLQLTGAATDAVIAKTINETSAAGLSFPLALVANQPPALDLPFAQPQRWQFNGVHTWTGDENGSPMSSLDFTRTWTLNWGDSTANDWVTAAHDGIVTIFSSCFLEVQHHSGWGTRYYHLDNLQVVHGQSIRAGEPLGTYASDREQALCSGGSSTGPHLHFALLKDGQYFSLQDVQLSGYQVHPGTSSYDQSRDRMWLEKRGTRYFAFNLPISIEEGDNTIDYRFNGMWFSPANNGHGVNVEITEFDGEDTSRNAVFIVLYTYDETGAANFYVGNVDFERWRSDEAMVVPMLQTAGGDFSSLKAIDFNDPDQVKVAGQAEIGFIDCNNAVVNFDLAERSTGQQMEHSIDLSKLIGVPEHVCTAASVPLPVN